jgi:hypothetical protein
MKPTIHGDRVCHYCHGLCHEESCREIAGRRKMYFCNWGHLAKWLIQKYGEVSEDLMVAFSKMYETVDVISL